MAFGGLAHKLSEGAVKTPVRTLIVVGVIRKSISAGVDILAGYLLGPVLAQIAIASASAASSGRIGWRMPKIMRTIVST